MFPAVIINVIPKETAKERIEINPLSVGPFLLTEEIANDRNIEASFGLEAPAINERANENKRNGKANKGEAVLDDGGTPITFNLPLVESI